MKLVTVVLAALIASSMLAQTVRESVEVRVVEIEAIVLDRAGKPVEGLTKNDFEVTIDGRPSEVTNFFTVRRGSVLDDTTNEGGIDMPGVKVMPEMNIPTRLLVVIDDVHMSSASKKRAIDALRKYVETSMDDTTTAMIMRWNGTMTVRVRPTSDRATLLRELTAVSQEPTASIATLSERTRLMRSVDTAIQEGGESRIPGLTTADLARTVLREIDMYSMQQQHDVEQTIEALWDLVAMASSLDGRKVVLYVSEGLPVQPGAELRDYALKVFSSHALDDTGTTRVEDLPGGNTLDSSHYDVMPAFRGLTQRAQSSGVVFSALDPGGLRGFEGTGAENAAGMASLDTTLIRSNASQGMRMVAAESGGKFLENENDLDHAVAILTQSVSTYYSLGVQPASKQAIDIQVSIRGRKDLRVVTPRRRGLVSEEEAIASSIRARLYSREQANPLDATVALGTAWPNGTKCVAPVQIMIPPEKLTLISSGPMRQGEVSIYAVALDDHQQESEIRTVKRSIALQPGDSFTESVVFGFQPRRYLISIAIVDTATGLTSYLLKAVDAKICGK
ncbi:MAG: hypothetical protein QOH21_2594 [Acidobacteriota bacterium]|jgi:VWFA-related protein|nr:hypothetical protein [Acidobacteriota bacterium]